MTKSDPRNSRYVGLFFVSVLTIIFGQYWMPICSQTIPKETGKTKGLEVIFVVDVSSGVVQHTARLEKFINSAYDAFKKNTESAANNYHLITFADKVGHFKGINIDKEFILDKIRSQVNPNHFDSCPRCGLTKIFDLVDDHFPQRVGIVLFVRPQKNGGSDPTDAQVEEEIERVIVLLKKIGFTVFKIFLSTLENGPDIQRKADIIAKEAFDIEFSSPVSRREYNKIRFDLDHAKKENRQPKVKIIDGHPTIESPERGDSTTAYQEETKTTKESNWFWLVLMALIILASFLRYRYICRIRQEMLWGKLVPRGDNDDKGVIDLSNRLKGAVIKTPGDAPNFRLFNCNHYGRRIMCVQVKNGVVDYFISRNGKEYKTDQHLGAESKFIRISNKFGNQSCEYEYQFLDILKNSWIKPAQIDLFCDREDIIREIRENFLEEKKKDCYDLFISGIGCSGKTSLLRYLELYFKDDNQLEEKCSVGLLEYHSSENTDFVQFNQALGKKIADIIKYKRKRKVLLVDNYDELLLNAEASTLDLIRDCHSQHEIYFVLAGKIPASLIHDKYSEFLTEKYKEITLKGVKNLDEVLNSIFDQMGFKSSRLSREVKEGIDYYSSGFPYFCKRILFELLTTWLNHYKKISLNRHDVENAALKVAREEEEYYLKQIVLQYDENDRNRRDRVRFRDIIKMLSETKGDAARSHIERELTFDKDEKFLKEKKKSFQEKLEQLMELGLVIEQQGWLQGIPRLFYLDREGRDTIK